jgi:pimeloyl-ACP methyl ester carboxylesterase
VERNSTIRTRDGRDLRVLESGTLDGMPVIVHHGTPDSRIPHREAVRDAQSRGIRLVTFDRAGYGLSDPKPGRSVADVAADVEDLADALGIDRFASWGHSGGGPHALALGALMPDRVAAVASLASVAPYDADGLDFMAGMGADNIEEFGAALKGPDALRPLLEGLHEEVLGMTLAQVLESLESLFPPVDKAVMTGEFGETSLLMMKVGQERGYEGWLDDDIAFTKPWGFDVADISVPVLLWQGRQDTMVPFAHGEWLAARIPNVEARLTDEDGHMTLAANRIPETHAWLMERFAN